jgi:hypothetical protein
MKRVKILHNQQTNKNFSLERKGNNYCTLMIASSIVNNISPSMPSSSNIAASGPNVGFKDLKPTRT